MGTSRIKKAFGARQTALIFNSFQFAGMKCPYKSWLQAFEKNICKLAKSGFLYGSQDFNTGETDDR